MDFIPKTNFGIPDSMQSELNKVLEQIYDRNTKELEKIDRNAFIQAVTQAILCGDFKRQIFVGDDSRIVVYLPHQHLKCCKGVLTTAVDDIQSYYVNNPPMPPMVFNAVQSVIKILESI